MKNIVKWAEPHVVLSLYLSASASMSNAKLSFKTRETTHDYDGDDQTNVKFSFIDLIKLTYAVRLFFSLIYFLMITE